MAKKKAKADKPEMVQNMQVVDPFIGAEEDDLSDMAYVMDETTTSKVETHPPETKEEAELIAQAEEVTEDGEAEESTAESSGDSETEETDGETDGEIVADEEAPAAEEEAVGEEEVLDEKPQIPKDRFDEVNDRMKRAEDRVKELQEQLSDVIEKKTVEPEPDPFDYVGKNQEAVDAILEGDSKRYAEIQEEIRQATKAEALKEAAELASEGDHRLQETMTFDEVGREIEREYPQFVEGNDTYVPEAYSELMDLYEGYARSGRFTKIDAFKKAAKQAAKIHGLAATSEVVEEETPDNVVNIKKPDIEKKRSVADAQPPITKGGVTEDEPKIDPVSMSDEEFEGLPEATKRRIRGDIL